MTEAPGLILCKSCGRPILAVLVKGLDRHIDTAALTQEGELFALLTGRATFEIRGDVIYRRSPEKIATGERKQPVLAEHNCTPIPEAHIDVSWSQAAASIIMGAIGATLISDTTVTPPF